MKEIKKMNRLKHLLDILPKTMTINHGELSREEFGLNITYSNILGVWMVNYSNLGNVLYHTYNEDIEKALSEMYDYVNFDGSDNETNTSYDVAIFDKRYYGKEFLETKTKEQKVDIAKKDEKHCELLTFKEYEDRLNAFRPKNEYVWTFFVND